MRREGTFEPRSPEGKICPGMMSHTLRENQRTISDKILAATTSIEWVLLCTQGGGRLETLCPMPANAHAARQVPKLREFAQRLAHAYDQNDPAFDRDHPPFVQE
mmetsp:Transcript_40578/g.111643  ORF Transcript_40578/g.111643 Transcript_40578/m.111643 type:complete len:104 (+) Transcript_40578:450-761(+)